MVLDLPFPPSANLLTRHAVRGGRLVSYTNPAYASWRAEAAAMYAQQKSDIHPAPGAFSYHITLDEARWPRSGDGDNRGKAVLDFLQSAEIIANDKYAVGGSWAWGPVEGCRVQIWPATHARIRIREG